MHPTNRSTKPHFRVISTSFSPRYLMFHYGQNIWPYVHWNDTNMIEQPHFHDEGISDQFPLHEYQILALDILMTLLSTQYATLVCLFPMDYPSMAHLADLVSTIQNQVGYFYRLQLLFLHQLLNLSEIYWISYRICHIY